MTESPKWKPGLKERIRLEVHRSRFLIDVKLHRLRYLFWEATLRCNMNCVHCGSDCTRDDSIVDMPVSDFLRVARGIAETCDPSEITVAVTGGEPLLRKDLEEAGDALTGMGYTWGLVTNGWAMTPRRLYTLLKAGLRIITVSLDGPQEFHDRFRRKKGACSRAMNLIKTCGAISSLHTDVVTCVTPQNFRLLPKLRDTVNNLGIQSWRLTPVFPRGRGTSCSLQGEGVTLLLNLVERWRSEGDQHISVSCEGFLGPWERKVRDSLFYCHAGISIGSVMVNGAIGACPSLRHDFDQGNIYIDDFMDVWERRFGLLRDRMWTKRGICVDCTSHRWCMGGGMHLWSPEADGPMRCLLAEAVGRM